MGEDVAPHRDRVMAFFQWERAEGFALGIADAQEELPFPERALAAHPGQEEMVLDAAFRLRRAGLYKKDTDAFFTWLEKSAPALLPVFLDAAAEQYLTHQYDYMDAAAYFGRARKAEREQARTMDQGWLNARYQAFADAGALSGTALRARAKELAVRGSATVEQAVAFRDVLARRIVAGHGTGGVYPQLPTDLRRVAKAAGLDPEEELATLLEEAGVVGRTSLHEDAFWTDVLKGRAFDLFCDRQPDLARAEVLDICPDRRVRHRLWQTLLERSGALSRLLGDVPSVTAVPVGETARWLERCLESLRDREGPSQVIHEVAERIALRLAADGVPLEIQYKPMRRDGILCVPLDLMDLLLERGVPLADPPKRLGSPHMRNLKVARRPELRFLTADPRFARELRSLMRAVLDMESGFTVGGNNWYQPHELKGWREVPELFANDLGHEVLREWFADERARLGAGLCLGELALLLGRFVHAGGAVDAVLKDSAAAAEFAAVDLLGMLMAELPDVFDRVEIETLVRELPTMRIATSDQSERTVLDRLRALLPEARADELRWAHRQRVQTAVNCRAGLDRLVKRLSPEPEAGAGAEAEAEAGAGRRGVVGGAATAVPRTPSGFAWIFAELEALAAAGQPVWQGKPESRTTEIQLGLNLSRRFMTAHAFTARHALGAVPRGRRRNTLDAEEFAEYAACPFVGGGEEHAGRWRIVRTEIPEGRSAFNGWAYRTETSAAVVLEGRKGERTLLEYAPGGDFPEDGPLAAAGSKMIDAQVLKPQRSAAWYARYAQLWRERGGIPARPELAAAFAARLGLTVADATVLLVAQLDCEPHQLAEPNPRFPMMSWPDRPWKVRRAEADTAVEGFTELLSPADVAELYDRLLPDDPELLWTAGPDVERAAAWWLERFGEPQAVPANLLALAQKEITRPKGEYAHPRDKGEDLWWPALRLPALTGRIAAGAAVLDRDLPALTGEPDLLGPVRVAAWLAYRTPAGDPLRPAIGAAIARLRAELAAGHGPLTVFSLQSNYLMGAPESPESIGLTNHPAVAVEEDPTYRMRNVRIDPAALTGAGDPVLERLDDYLDSVLPSQWLPTASGLPALADLRVLLSEEFGALGEHLAADAGRAAGWEQDPSRSVPHLVEACAAAYGLSADAAAYHLMLLALPDPTDRHVKEWTGWKPARFKAACAELEASGRVIRADRSRAGRALFVAGTWLERKAPRFPLEAAKGRTLGPVAAEHRSTAHTAVVPHGPIPALFEQTWAEATARAC
ncbi:hypothetical protein [Streptomyces sp. ISL-100]|uniref:hypothetical protein n=1 Tax=Streptomyces sp. ISL-100 TaxID=2819173 RepID=UPI001BECF21D|nr:hypothetical protein [Streptomyces sp. ISL-100]MBT2394939.1 hypothetical protein [Streptomyces sp. ISL-100]